MAKTSEEDFESVTHHNTIFRVELCALGGDVGEAATAVKCTMVAQEYQGYLTHHSSRNCVSKGLLEDNDGLIILNSGDELEGGQGSWGSFPRRPLLFQRRRGRSAPGAPGFQNSALPRHDIFRRLSVRRGKTVTGFKLY